MMPILTVDMVMRPDEEARPGLARALADAAGEVFGSAPGRTWVTVRLVASEQYAENQRASGELFPVFVTVLKARLLESDTLAAEAAMLTSAVARCCGRPEESVHLLYQPDAVGRIAFGGHLLA